MKKIAHSLLVIGLSCWFLAGCVGADMDDVAENDEALAQAEDAYQEQEAFSAGEEELYSEEFEAERDDYSTEYCSGFSGAGSVCHVRCANYQWYAVGCYYGCSPFVDYNQCIDQGNSLCRRIGWGPSTANCWN